MPDQTRFHLAGVMGFPVLHSRSPMIHKHWLREHGLTGEYMPIAVQPANLEKALRALPALGFAGVNLTIPLKEAALAIVDHVDPLARRIGAINCVAVAPDGALSGFNYDAIGYLESLREAQPSWRADAGPAAILGSGGAARAIIAGLLEEGTPEIRLCNRTRARAEALASDFGPKVRTVDWQERSTALAGTALLVNTTSMGMKGQPPLEISLKDLPSTALVSDIVYTPLETGLLHEARVRGNTGVDGLGMLLHQAVPAFATWFGITPRVTPDLRRMVEASL